LKNRSINNNSTDKLRSPWSQLNRPLLIAEIGGNHEGDFEKANLLIDLAINSAADVIKFQIYKADSLVSKIESPERHKHFKKFELSKSQHIALAEKCISNGKLYTSSIWDSEDLSWIDPYVEFYKIGSGDLTAFPIIKEIVKLKKPIVLSTGLSNKEEVLETVEFIQSIDKIYKNHEMLCLLQCTSMYPITTSDVNLNVMLNYKETTNLSVGYSDHTEGINALKIAASMGADVLEFHFTNDRKNKKFRDHKVSLIKDEVNQLKCHIDLVNKIKGNSEKKLLQTEIDNNHHKSFRRAIYLNKSIKKGDIIKKQDMIFLRPLEGTDARLFSEMEGSKALKNIEPLEAIFKNIDYKND
tara:strand:- start:18675 stop:19739 length:1065 start_codon:yes stop_codon:yes gene_type:complete